MSRRLREDPDAEMARTLRRIVLAVLTLAGLFAFILWRIDNPRVERFRMAVADALAPSLGGLTEPMASAARAAEDWSAFISAHDDNRELRREIARLRAWRDVAQELERENARLRALNNVRLPPRVGFATGEIVADGGSPFARSVLVDVGGEDGVSEGDAALDGGGLVGRTVGVGERTARLLLLTDPASRVPVVVEPSGRRAILIGDGDAAPRLGFLSDPQGVSIGDRVTTSGAGGAFPPDLPVGVVGALGDRVARVRLAADYRRLDFVRVLRWRPEAPLDDAPALILPPQAPAETPPAEGEAEAGPVAVAPAAEPAR